MTGDYGDTITQDMLEYEPSLPPPYDDDHPPPLAQARSSLYYRHFPSIMTIKAGLSRSFMLCDKNSNEALYLAEFHPFGWFCTKPLGARGGFILHDGVSSTDSILAAAGDITVFEQRINTFSNKSHILLPPLAKNDKTQASRGVTQTETMTGKSTANNGVSFQFSIEAGRFMERKRFEWRSVEGNDEGVAWKLVRCRGASRKAPSEGEIIAKLSWVSISLGDMVDLWNPKSIFTLQLMNSLESGLLGERCTLTVVMSALRLWHLRIKGKDRRSYIKIGEKFMVK